MNAVSPHDLTPNRALAISGLPPVDIAVTPTLADLKKMSTDHGRKVAEWWIGSMEHHCGLACDRLEMGGAGPRDGALKLQQSRLEAIRKARQEFLHGRG